MASRRTTNDSLQILVVEDVAADFELIEHELRRSGLSFTTTRIDDFEEFSRELHQQPPDVVLCDHGNARLDSFSVLEIVRAGNKAVPFVIVTGAMPEAKATEAITRGADEIVLKHRLGDLTPALQRALRLGETRRRLAEVEQERDRLRTELEIWRFGRPRSPVLVPICAGCKKVHTPDDRWELLERHFGAHFNIRFSHGICPDCVPRYS